MEKERKILQWILPILAIAIPANLIFGVARHSRSGDQADAQLRKFNTVVNTIRDYYVDGSEDVIGYPQLVDSALEGMLQNLDRHSHYLNKDQYKSARERMAGEFEGIGIVYTQTDGEFTVQNVLPGGPADKAGLKPNDKIQFVDGEDLYGKAIDEATKLLKGDKGMAVKLGIMRDSENMEIELVRDVVKLPSIRGIREFPGNILYVYVTQFTSKTGAELQEAMASHSDVQGLILDVRQNPGGLLTAAQKVCSLFLSAYGSDGKRREVVSIIPRDKKQANTRYVLQNTMKYLQLPIVVLVDGQSASASEIVAGCFKDYGRATLVGTRTYGKGSVQQERPLGDGTAIRITTAKYYTPSRTVIHERGIEPDVSVPLRPDAMRQALGQITADVELEERLEADPQLSKALELLTPKAP